MDDPTIHRLYTWISFLQHDTLDYIHPMVYTGEITEREFDYIFYQLYMEAQESMQEMTDLLESYWRGEK